jgi:hypothetical protein
MVGGIERDALSEIDPAHLLDPTSLIIHRVNGTSLLRCATLMTPCSRQQLLVENSTYIVAITDLAMSTEKLHTTRLSGKQANVLDLFRSGRAVDKLPKNRLLGHVIATD